MTTRTQIFKDSWAHRGVWSSRYSYPACTDYQNPSKVCATPEGASRAAAAYWQEVADSLREGMVFGLLCQ